MYALKRDDSALRIELGADFRHIDRVCADILMFLKEQGVEGISFDVSLIVREALCNAIMHGADNDPSRRVLLRLALKNGELHIRVTDDGPGFDWRKLHWNLPPSRSEAGRGLCIVKSYSDRVTFNEQGNEIEMVKRLKGQEVK